MKLIKTVCATNSIKWKFGKISISRVLVDNKSRLSVYFFGIRIFREPLRSIIRTPNAANVCLSQFQSSSEAERGAVDHFSSQQAFDLFPEYFKTLLRLQAWNIIAKRSRCSFEAKE